MFDALAEAAGLVKVNSEPSVYPYDFGTDADFAYVCHASVDTRE